MQLQNNYKYIKSSYKSHWRGKLLTFSLHFDFKRNKGNLLHGRGTERGHRIRGEEKEEKSRS